MSAIFQSLSKFEIPKKNQTATNQSNGIEVDPLLNLEMQLKELWSQYIGYLDRNGPDETANYLKSTYFSLYRTYQKNKNWRNAVTHN